MTVLRRVVARRPFRVRGSIRPLRAGLVLVIARKGADGVFHTVARVPLKAVRGAYGVTVRLRRPALHRLRVVSRAMRATVPGARATSCCAPCARPLSPARLPRTRNRNKRDTKRTS